MAAKITAAPRWLTLLFAAAAAACAHSGRDWSGASTYVYRCDGEQQAIVVTIKDGRGHLFARRASQPIYKQPDSTAFVGADVRYQPLQEEGLAPAQRADISIAGRDFADCKNDPQAAVWEGAKLRGVSYRAVGQEPPWVLEIDRGEGFLLVTRYGEQKHRYPYAEPAEDAQRGTARYSSGRGEDRITITITGERCHDSMSGESFSGRVEIDWRKQTLRGCGRPLY